MLKMLCKVYSSIPLCYEVLCFLQSLLLVDYYLYLSVRIPSVFGMKDWILGRLGSIGGRLLLRHIILQGYAMGK